MDELILPIFIRKFKTIYTRLINCFLFNIDPLQTITLILSGFTYTKDL